MESMDPENEILSLCKEAIDSAQYLTSTENLHLQINKQQSKLLAKKLSGIRPILELLFEKASASAADCWEQAIKELCRILKLAEALIKDCCCSDGWLKAAIRQGDKTQDFLELVHDVEWCTSVLCGIYFERSSQQTSNLHVDVRACECEGKLSITDYFTLEAAAKEDRDSLKASLKVLKEDHVCVESCKLQHQTEQCLAAQLFQRLQAQNLPISQSDVRTSPLILWANNEDVIDGIKLGKGTMGKVYESMWQGEKYAKKKFLSDDTSLFNQEVAIIAGLEHPHIMRLVCCCPSKSGSILMEYMPNDLQTLLHMRPAPFSNLRAVDLMLQLAEGMKYLHAKNVAHRDLKSNNILVKFTDLPASLGEDACLYGKICDFGLSKIKNLSTRYSHQTTEVGTRQWKAPEVFSVEDEEDPPTRFHPLKTDVYSFGIVCAEILTREEPFGNNLRGLRSRVRGGERPKLPKSCPRRLAFLVENCWDGHPLQRPDFVKICQELRYIKELLLKDDRVQLEKLDTYPFQSKGIQVQGPWGGTGGSHFYDGIATSIRGFELKFDKSPPCIWSIKVEYDVSGASFKSSEHGDSKHGNKFEKMAKLERVCKDIMHKKNLWLYLYKILFSTDEFLMKIEGSFGFVPYSIQNNQCTGICSLTFHTNVCVYGPYGDEGETKFMTNLGSVVGLFGRAGMAVDQLGAFISQD